jgi:hypothetical protein
MRILKRGGRAMAYPIDLGLVLEGEDARAFLEDIVNPPEASAEEISAFKEAIKIYSLHRV